MNSEPSVTSRLKSWRENGFHFDSRSIATAFLVALFVCIAARDITRPFYGLHGYAQAHAAWAARAHARYGLGYTHGLGTFAVGYPPAENPARYLDHPPLPAVVSSVAVTLLGAHEWTLRSMALIVYALSLPFLLALLRRRFDESTAVLSVFVFILLPVTGYFYNLWDDFWMLPLSITAWWSYLALLGELRGVVGSRRHYWMLGASLFFMIQTDWVGAFYGAAIGIHYVARCLHRRTWPERRLFLVLLLAPLTSFLLALTVLLAAGGWDVSRMIGLFMFRSAAGGTPDRTPARWFLTQWEYVQANFSLPVIIIVVVYLAWLIGSKLVRARSGEDGHAEPARSMRAFPFLWLFLGPALLNMMVFREAFWVHQFQYVPFAIFVSIATALGILQIRDVLIRHSRMVGDLATLCIVVVVVGFCARGLNLYYEARQFPENALALFTRLNTEIPPDGTLLAYDPYIYQEGPFKPAFMRPEIAWALDRKTLMVRSTEEVERLAADGRYQYYLADSPPAPAELLDSLKARYRYEFIKGMDYRPWPHLLAYWPDKYLFNLRAPVTAEVAVRAPTGVDSAMKAGLAALYDRNDPAAAAIEFRKVLLLSPGHYGGMYQLAKALDLIGKPEEARPLWESVQRIAESVNDQATLAIVRTRLSKRP